MPAANTTPVYQRGRARYVILALHDVVNLDTGERVEFDLPKALGLLRVRQGALVPAQPFQEPLDVATQIGRASCRERV